MEYSGSGKFESMPATLLSKYKCMFSCVADTLSWNDVVSPAPSYKSAFKEWKEAADDTLTSIVADGELELTAAEEDGLEAARQIAFGIIEKFIEKGTASGWAEQTPEARRKNVERILSLPQVPQRTDAWYKQGQSVLTASEFATIFGSLRAVRQMAFQKMVKQIQLQTNRLACLTCEMGPFDWGIRFEPVVKLVLEKLWGAKIVDSGRLMHPTDPLLAASPDGLIVEATDPKRIGRLLEIKCPISREIGETIPFEYWCQMQIQMEVTGIDECEYVEVKIDSISPKRADLSGCDTYVWLFQDSTNCRMSYAYTEAEKKEAETAGLDLIETIPWRVGKLYTKTVTRDRSWFQGTAEKRKEFWDIVDQARKGDIQPFEVKSKLKINVTKEPECRIVDEA